MRWSEFRACLMPCGHSPHPGLWNDDEWAEELCREQEDWNRIMLPALRRYEEAQAAFAESLLRAMGSSDDRDPDPSRADHL